MDYITYPAWDGREGRYDGWHIAVWSEDRYGQYRFGIPRCDDDSGDWPLHSYSPDEVRSDRPDEVCPDCVEYAAADAARPHCAEHEYRAWCSRCVALAAAYPQVAR